MSKLFSRDSSVVEREHESGDDEGEDGGEAEGGALSLRLGGVGVVLRSCLEEGSKLGVSSGVSLITRWKH